MEEQKFRVIIVEDVKLELKGTEEIFRHEIPNAEVIGTAMTENEFWPLMEAQLPDLVLLDLGLGGSTTIGVDICRNIFKRYKGVRVLIFTGEILNEKLWVDVLNAGADGIILKTGELLTKTDVQAVMDGNFPTVVSPNPEDRRALEIGIQQAKKIDADIVLGTDPDSDRVGIAVKGSDGSYRLVTGNQVGALLMNFILKNTDLSKYSHPAIVKTIVTSELGARYCKETGN